MGSQAEREAAVSKAFWTDSRVAVIGGGTWGTVLAQLVARNAREVRLWVKDEDTARAIGATRQNPEHVSELRLDPKIQAVSDPRRAFESGVQAWIWALPSNSARAVARELAQFVRGDEVILHATKGVEEREPSAVPARTWSERLTPISQVLLEELPTRRVGVISGPNLADEVARGMPAVTVVASAFGEVVDAGAALLSQPKFKVVRERDVAGVEWAGALKNVVAVAGGALETLGVGNNARAWLLTQGLREMTAFGVAMGARRETFMGPAGLGDLLTTALSPLSRNFRVGQALGQGKSLKEALEAVGSVAEGVRTARILGPWLEREEFPVFSLVYRLTEGEAVNGVFAGMWN